MLQTYFVSGLRDPIWTVKFNEAEMTKYILPVLPRKIFAFFLEHFETKSIKIYRQLNFQLDTYEAIIFEPKIQLWYRISVVRVQTFSSRNLIYESNTKFNFWLEYLNSEVKIKYLKRNSSVNLKITFEVKVSLWPEKQVFFADFLRSPGLSFFKRTYTAKVNRYLERDLTF